MCQSEVVHHECEFVLATKVARARQTREPQTTITILSSERSTLSRITKIVKCIAIVISVHPARVVGRVGRECESLVAPAPRSVCVSVSASLRFLFSRRE